MDEHDPGRWTRPDADVPDSLRQVLLSASADEASPARLAAFVGRMKSTLAAQPSAATAARFGAAKSVAVAGVVAAGGAVLAWLAFGTPSEPRTRTPESRPAVTDVGSTPSALATPTPDAPQVRDTAPAPQSSAVSASAARQAVPAFVAAPRVARLQSPGGGDDTLEREVRLLSAARRLLDTDPAGALRVAEQHRARYPNGILSQEREVLSIQALARQGRSADAQSRADRFRRQYPDSAHSDQLPQGPNADHN